MKNIPSFHFSPAKETAGPASPPFPSFRPALLPFAARSLPGPSRAAQLHRGPHALGLQRPARCSPAQPAPPPPLSSHLLPHRPVQRACFGLHPRPQRRTAAPAPAPSRCDLAPLFSVAPARPLALSSSRCDTRPARQCPTFPSFLLRVLSFLCPSMARLRWKTTGAHMESA